MVDASAMWTIFLPGTQYALLHTNECACHACENHENDRSNSSIQIEFKLPIQPAILPGSFRKYPPSMFGSVLVCERSSLGAQASRLPGLEIGRCREFAGETPAVPVKERPNCDTTQCFLK